MTDLSALGAFHFLRPEWLLASLPAAALIAVVWRALAQGLADDWAEAVDSHLLKHLTVQGTKMGRSRGLTLAFGAGLFAAVLGVAGPTWTKAPVPAFQGNAPVVVVLSLAQSMNGTDIVPSRFTRASHKLRDILDRVRGDDTALVIYSDRPFVASPLTSDTAVIRQMLPELSTGLMPVLGNHLDLAITEAKDLIGRAGASRGTIVVLADDSGQDPQASVMAAKVAADAGLTVAVLGVGTEAGSLLQTAQGQAIHTRDGKDVTMHLDAKSLRAIAQAGHGAYAAISADDSDLQALLPAKSGALQAAGKATDATSDAWQDMGYWLLLIPVLLAPLAFRRGMLFAVMLGLSGLAAAPRAAQAGVWDNLWATPDQQGQRAFEAGDFVAASGAFTDANRKAAALYRGDDFAAASGGFSDSYNRGNALAKAGQFEAAIAAYDEALTITPQDADTAFNRDLVAKLLDQQKQKEQKDKQESESAKDTPQDQDQAGKELSKGQSGDQKDQKQDQALDKQGQPKGGSDAAQGQAGEPASVQPDAAQAAQEKGDKPAGNQPGNAQAAQDQTGTPKGQQQGAAQDTGDKSARDASNAQASKPTETAQNGKPSGFSDQMDKTLAAQADQKPASTPSDLNAAETAPDSAAASAAGAFAQLDQAAEQQLRAVPDDPSGLLRARIRQHYARQLAANR